MINFLNSQSLINSKILKYMMKCEMKLTILYLKFFEH